MSSSTSRSTLPLTGRVGPPETGLPAAIADHALPPFDHAAVMGAGLALLIAGLFGYEMHGFGRAIAGPFIFGDELEYFLYGHDLFLGADLAKHTQYGILYPILLAISFTFGDNASVYHGMRACNVALMASSIVPSFLLARALLPGNSIAWLLLSVVAATSAFTALADMIWADPLYFTLFQWLVFSLFVFYRRPRIATGCIIGVLLGLLFHAKPGAGIVVEAAAIVSLVALLGDEAMRPVRRSLVGPVLAIILTCGVLTVPWLIRNLSLGVGPIGYADHTQQLKSLVAAIGTFGVAKLIFWSSFYQLSYLLVATWGLLGVLVIAFVRWKALPSTFRGLTVLLVACTVGLIALLSFGMRSDRDYEYWMPFGRYLSVASPAIVILAVSLLRLDPPRRRREMAYLIAAMSFLAVIAAWASPLTAIGPRIIVDAPDLALAMTVIDHGQVIARHGYDATLLQRVGFAGFLACFGLFGILAANRRRTLIALLVLVLSGSIMVSVAEHRYMAMLGAAQSPTNEAIEFLRERKADLEHAVGIDRDLEQTSNTHAIADFWDTARIPLRYIAADVLEQRGRERDLEYFISTKILPFPVAFKAPGIYVYILKS